MHKFTVKYDLWILILALVAFIGFPLSILIDPNTSIIIKTAALCIGGFFCWVFFFARYEMDKNELTTIFGPIKFRFLIKNINSVSSGDLKTMLTGANIKTKRVRLAFSQDNLILSLEGTETNEVVISPKDKRKFINALKSLKPSINVNEKENKLN